MTRYSRQALLPEIGTHGQRRLQDARVLVVGAGGLGCPALQYLAAAGIGTLGIIDPDIVDLSNLQRQILFQTGDTGQPKAVIARDRLLCLNPDIVIHAYVEALTADNAISFLSAYDIVIDGTDNFAAKFLINDAAVKLKKTVVYGAIQGFDGQVSVFDATRGPCYRCLSPDPPQASVQNCAEAGIIGAVAGMIGTAQAMEAIKVIINDASFRPLIGRLWIVDARTLETRIINFSKKTNCPVCSKTPADITLPSASSVCCAGYVEEITCCDVSALPGATLIDVRELHEWQQGHIEGARHLPLSALQKNPEAFAPLAGADCILYCQRGQRSKNAAEILASAGFMGLRNLKGGYDAWLTYARRDRAFKST